MKTASSTVVVRNVAVALIGLAVLAGFGVRASTFTWNLTTPPGTYNWSTAGKWDIGASYPKTSADLAVIDNRVPAGWDTGFYTINIDATDINGADLSLTDQDTYSAPTKPTNVQIHVQVQQDATFDRIDWYNDPNGAGRSRLAITAGKTLRVNTINMTGRFPDSWGVGGTLRFNPDGGGAATYNYEGGTEQLGGGGVYDHQDVTTMTYHQNGNGAYLEGRDCSWIVGNAVANQTWNVTNGQLRLVDRNVGGAWNFIKVGNNDVDMGYRSGSSDGVFIDRNGSGDFGGLKGSYYLFTDASGNPLGGTVKIARYNWQETGNAGATNMSYDKLGTNLTITTGGFSMTGTTSASANDVSLFWVTPSRTLLAQGATSGDITVNDSSLASTGRMGIYFAGSTVDADRNLSVLGPNTFLNDGGSASSVKVGGNLIVQSRNPSGFGSITGLPSGATVAWDDFDLRATTLTMDGGGLKTLDWNTAAALGGPTLVAGDFSLANFMLGSLAVTNGTTAAFTANRNLFLGSNLSLDGTSSLNMYLLPWTGASHIYLQGTTQLGQIQGWISSGQLQYAGITQVGSVGLDIFGIPEPASVLLFVAGSVFLFRRRPRS